MPAACISAASVHAFSPHGSNGRSITSTAAASSAASSGSYPSATNGSRSSFTSTSAENPRKVPDSSAKIASISRTRSLRCSPGCVPISMPSTARDGYVA